MNDSEPSTLIKRVPDSTESKSELGSQNALPPKSSGSISTKGSEKKAVGGPPRKSKTIVKRDTSTNDRDSSK